MGKRLAGLRILVVEDQYFIAVDLVETIRRHGGIPIGPAAGLEQARSLIRAGTVDGAILDVKLDDGTSFPLADELAEQGTPVILATGYGAAAVPPEYAHLPRLIKPFHETALVRLAEERFRR